LVRRVEEIGQRTDRMLQYVGEWHSHPAGSDVKPSKADHRVFSWLSELRAPDGFPPLMLIVGDGETKGWYLERIQ